MLPQRDGIALLCDAQARVKRLLFDGLGIAARLPAGTPVQQLFDPEVVDKVGGFLRELQHAQAAFDWQLTILHDGVRLPFHFGAGRLGDDLLLVGARSRDAMVHLYDELTRINNEQTNALRRALKDAALRAKAPPQRDDDLLEAMTRLNNELANVQRELARKNAELEKLNQAKNQWLGMAAHDLRTPLGVILSYSEFLETEATLNTEQHAFVRTIKEASDFMLGLIDDLLDVSLIEAGRLALDLQPTDLAALVQANVVLHRALSARKNIELQFSAPSDPVPVSVDARKLTQVLNNLIGNAVKYSPRDSTVFIAVRADPQQVSISVRDQGQGISAAELPRLFAPFGKGSARGTAGEKSTGLGLAIVRRIVQGHGGEVGVDSLPGQGATFTVRLPRGGPA